MGFAPAYDLPLDDATRLFPFAVDWSSSVRVGLSFKTEILTARAGKEQRRAVRSTPRKTLDYSAIAHRDEFQAFRAQMAGWQNRALVIADETRRVRVTVGGDASVRTSALPDWIVVGATVVLVEGRRREIRTIQATDVGAGNLVTFTTVGAAWSTRARVHPGLSGMLPNNFGSNQLTDNLVQIPVRFQVAPTSEPPRAAGEAGEMLNGREIFDAAPNWRDPINVSYLWPSESVDYGRGPIAVFRPVPFGSQLFQATYYGLNAEASLALQQFFERAKGQRGEFYMSTRLSDLLIKTPAAGGDTQFRIAGDLIYRAYATSLVHRAIEVVMRDGRRFCRQLAAATPITVSGGDSFVHIQGMIPYAVTPDNVSRISWLPACRFASDDVTFEFRTDEVSQVQLPIQTLEDLPVE